MAQINKLFLSRPNEKIKNWLRRPTYSISIDVDLTKGYVLAPSSARMYSEVKLQAIPNEGFKFIRWSDGNEDATRKIVVVNNISLVAEFDVIPKISITAIPDDPLHGTVSGSGEYDDGTAVLLRAMPFENWKFIKWNDENSQNPRTVIATEDKTYIAEFEDIFGTIIYEENY